MFTSVYVIILSSEFELYAFLVLILEFCLRCQIEVQNHWFFSCLYCLFRFWTFVLFHGLSCRHHSQENPNEIWINVQGCFVIQLSRFCAVLFCDATSLFYHTQKSLSRTFLIYFLMFCCFSWATRIFYHILIHPSSTFLFFFFIFQIRVKNITEKEGFEPSHRY